MRKFLSYFIVLFATVVLAGCGGRKAVDEGVEVEAVEGTAGGVNASGIGGDGSIGGQGLDGLDGGGLGGDGDLLSQRVVYFEYNSSILTQEGEAVVEAHAQYLSSAPNVQVILEGHADERGTREYNLALGEDRAKSVADVMQAFGISSSRIQTVSYGEERPVALGGDESAWALNRRVEILYQ